MASKDRNPSIISKIFLSTFAAILFCALAFPAQVYADESFNPLTSLPDFIEHVKDGNASSVRGVYVHTVMAFPIVQQPSGNAGYVSSQGDVVTQFELASQYGTIGLLAHNYLAGNAYFQLEPGDVITLVYGDGRTQDFLVDDVQQYQALNPYSPYSNFVNLDTRELLTAEELFFRVYSGESRLTLQTCIDNEGNSSWGRLFVIARPIGEKSANLLHQKPRRYLAIK